MRYLARLMAVTLAIFLFMPSGWSSPQSGYPEPAPDQQKDEGQKQDKAKDETQKDEKQNDKEKKKKKDKNKERKSADEYDTSVFSEGVANNVLNDLKDGLEGHSQRLMLSCFDQDKMDGYLNFEDQIDAFFKRYEGFRVHYRIGQTAIEGSKGVVLVDMQMEALPRGGSAPPVRRNGQIRFELERGRKGWKIVDFRPREFFS
jgi:hypothetical protein